MEKQYYNHINLLRGISTLMVCIYHFTNFSSIHGELFSADSIIRTVCYYCYPAVFVFFILSGFVIPLSLQNSGFTIKRFHFFMGKRYVRLEIPYLGSVLLFLLVGFLFSYAKHIPFEFDPARFVSHLFYTVSFTGHEWYNEIYWTLALEIQFYIVIALIFFLLKKNGLVVAITFILLLATSCFIVDNRLVFRYLPFFGAGMLCWMYKRNTYNPWLLLFLFIGCLAAAFYLFKFYEALVIVFTVMGVLLLPDMNKRNFLIGNMSYSLYLTHGVIGGNIIYFLLRYNTSLYTSLGVFCCAMISSLGFAYVFYRLIERPSMNLSKKIGKNKKP